MHVEGPAGVRNPSSAQLDVRWAARRTPPLIATVHLGDQIVDVSHIAENKKHICHLG
jgi:glutamine synthetase type III